MSEIVNMSEAMNSDGFTGDWYSAIHMGAAYRIQVVHTDDGKGNTAETWRVVDNYMNPRVGETADNLIEEVKEYRNEETN